METLSRFITIGDHLDPYRVVQATSGPSYYASGALGQYLDIVFDRRLIAVRMRRETPADYAAYATNTPAPNQFSAFITMALRLVPAGTP